MYLFCVEGTFSSMYSTELKDLYQTHQVSRLKAVPDKKAELPLKAMDTQNNCQHKKLLGNKQWRDVDIMKH